MSVSPFRFWIVFVQYHLWWEHAHLLVSEPNLSYLVREIDWIQQRDVIVFKTQFSSIRMSTAQRLFQNLHSESGEHFLRRCVFSDSWHRTSVDGSPNWRKNSPFSTNTCWRSLSISHIKYVQTLSKTDTFRTTSTKCPSQSNIRLSIESQKGE